MAPTKQTDHASKARGNLIEQFKSCENIEALLDVFSAQVQDLEDVLFELIDNRFLDDAVGEQLDGLGRIVNLQRNNLDDDTYRTQLKAQIATNASSGTVEDVVAVVSLILGENYTVTVDEFFGTPVDCEGGTASFSLRINEVFAGDGNDVAAVVADVKAAGVRATVEWYLEINSFQFSTGSGLTPSTGTKGLADSSFPSAGGFLASAAEA